jgi:hypothetical protein
MTTDPDELRVLAPTGVTGSGFLESSFERGLALKPHLIGADAGSTDPGPEYLGSGKTAFPLAAIKRDLRLMMIGARKIKVPLMIGTAGTGGNNEQLDTLAAMAKEIAAAEGLSFRLALIRAEQDKAYLKQRLREGRIKPLHPAPPYDEGAIERSSHVVGMMGAEPWQRALKAGADVILAGRSSDTAIFAAMPVMKGFAEGISWHMAKILECGAASCVQRRTPDCMFAWVRKDHFVVQAPDPTLRCTPQSIASHSLYENADPFKLVECSGTLDLTHSRYEAVSDTAVKVSGSQFIHAPRYTVKLEGAEKVGYMSILIGSVRDPFIIRQIDDWTARLTEKIQARVQMVFGDKLKPQDWLFNIRIYGKNGTMGPLEPVKETKAHELCLIFEATAPTQEIANTIGGITRHQALHLPIPEWSGLITAIACPYNAMERGAVYKFNVNHVVEPDSPTEMFPMELYEVSSANVKEIKQ